MTSNGRPYRKCPFKKRDIPIDVVNSSDEKKRNSYIPFEFGFCEGEICSVYHKEKGECGVWTVIQCIEGLYKYVAG